MKIRRKTQQCLNCGLTLNTVYHYCPRCGQENNNQTDVSFGTFVKEFFSNYFSFDTRIGRSIRPLFFKPGFLTNRFNEGKRVEYIHPLRMYLVVSLSFFFLVTLSSNSAITEFTTGAEDRFVRGFSSEIMGIPLDSVTSDSTEQIRQIILDKSLTNQEALDSLATLEYDSLPKTWQQRKIFSQARKMALYGLLPFISTAIRNLPIILLIAMPIFALLLKLLYIRRRQYYVQHLAHTLHIHSFTLLLFCPLIIIKWLGVSAAVVDYIEVAVVLLWLVYLIVSFRRVYQQGWGKTVTKVLLVNFMYSMLLSIIFASEVVLSFFIA
ncbi:DUF3667 domain-containing protein [Tunicatimonas pelagia]|uniref:DUF3667 domain-containing protein n=1 Tax=Tunicatimonas pelagia TaxID=931531 RepID=UPI002666BF15|nr:DUF3667 domain-containing protein [Tunicatimonas pelagia]WKN42912.1 DUF3667 domain-containing protein [Tunicatimonas pelagia]